MNHREPTHLPIGVRRALRCLSVLLIPAMTLEQAQAGNRVRIARHEPLGYLPVLGSPSLRIEEAPPPPDLVTRPPAAAPPIPSATPEESSVAQANSEAARSTVLPPEEDSGAQDNEPTAGPPAAPAIKTPPPILPDTTRPIIRPEDFLPYFQIPGSARNAGDVNLLVPGAQSAPTPPPIPNSSATYRQSP